jgi:hypothetical protein
MTTYPHPACMEPDGAKGPCAGYQALTDENERLRSALRQAEAYWSDYHVPCVYEEYDNDCDLCPVIAAVRAALQPLT